MRNRRVSSSGVGGRRRRAKRQYFGPRQAPPDLPVEDVAVEGVDEVPVSASARKLSSKPDWLEQDSNSASDDDLPSNPDSGSSSEEEDLEAQASVQGNRIADLQCLQSILDAVAVCSECKSGKLQIMASVQAGLGTTLRICCAEADCRKSFTVLLTERTGRVFDINKRSVLAMRRIGRGWSALNGNLGWTNAPLLH